ncbi:hypothetical protein QYF36_017994 [Acer negundo]|nr:hypothetical protein QYF36_017994 [Acer negundo]
MIRFGPQPKAYGKSKLCQFSSSLVFLSKHPLEGILAKKRALFRDSSLDHQSHKTLVGVPNEIIRQEMPQYQLGVIDNSIHISQVRDDVAAAYKKEMEWQTSKLLLLYKKMCSQRDVTVIESDDVAKSIAEELANCTINKLVIGAASQGMFTRYSSTVFVEKAKSKLFSDL